MPFDPDELANGLLRFIQDGREPPAGPPPAEMPGSGPSVAELQEQIQALQEQLKAINGNADVPMAPRGEPIYPLGPGRDAPILTPDEIRKRDLEEFDKWRRQEGGQHGYIGRRDIDPGFGIPPDPNAPDRDPGFSFGPGYMDPPKGGYEYDIVRPRPDYMDPPKAFMYPNKNKHIGDDLTPRRYMPDITEEGGPQEKPIDKYTEPMDAKPYTFLNEALDNRSPVEGLNLPVGRHGNNYTPSKVTPGKGASLN